MGASSSSSTVERSGWNTQWLAKQLNLASTLDAFLLELLPSGFQLCLTVASKRHCTMPLRFFFVCDGCGTTFARIYEFGPAGKRDK
uniref:Uncharacterized protein n=1 Tax=Globodera rostochiensis TaxID=31243 RepID=A0A914HQL4_GLORO